MRWLVALGLGSVLFVCIFMTRPVVIRSHRNSRQTSSISNLRQIGISLFEFESKYGKFPDGISALEVMRESRLTLSDRTSNDVFVQLIAAGLAEARFFETHSRTTRKPDGDWTSDATALEHGETGFAFVSGLSAEGNPSRPIVFGPVISGTKTLDRKSFDGKAVILKLDNSVTSVNIDLAGRIMINGFDLLDPKNPLWNGKAPDIKWPK